MYEARLITGTNQTIASAGTRERLVASSLFVRAVSIQALPGNTGNVFVGDSTVASSKPGVTLAPGDTYTIDGTRIHGGHTSLFDLTDIWIDAATTNDGVSFNYIADGQQVQ